MKYEKITYTEAKKMAMEKITIKDHECFFVQFKNEFGYSILVFKDKKHIYHADDFELHHSGLVTQKGITALREFYIQEMDKKLFTDKELFEELVSYDEYKRKDSFLRNLWIQRHDTVSIFAISKEDVEKRDMGIKTHPYYNNICFCYVADEVIVNFAQKVSAHLEAEKERLIHNEKTFRNMIAYELRNHEAGYTCSANDTLEAVGLNNNNLTAEQKSIIKEELHKCIVGF